MKQVGCNSARNWINLYLHRSGKVYFLVIYANDYFSNVTTMLGTLVLVLEIYSKLKIMKICSRCYIMTLKVAWILRSSALGWAAQLGDSLDPELL